LETDFGEYHDVNEEEKHSGFIVKLLPKKQILALIYNPDSYHSSKFWKCRHPDKTAGVIYSVLQGISLTPPLVTPDRSCDCLFLNSGCNRFAVGIADRAKSMPLLVRTSEIEQFEQLASAKLSR
ncbi:MAG: hypothetical protein ACI8UO_001953, partial [Verrucomicrobiales bacterium]